MRSRRAPAFSLVEALVALALIAIVAALVIPTAKSQLDKGEVTAVTANLQGIREAILAYRENVGFYPSQLVQLVTKPGVSGVTTNNSCGTAMLPAPIAKWRGPYLGQDVTTSGLPSGDVLILNPLVRSPVNTTTVPEGTLIVEVDNAVHDPPSQNFVNDVEAAIDGSTGSPLTTGAVRWANTLPSLTEGKLAFHIAIRGC
jgi:type II secretory pathway pseudopilin PulG